MLPRVAVAAISAVLLSSARPGEAAPPSSELRGLWVVRTALVSPESVDQVVDQAAEAGFNALFVQVRGRGDAFYRSSAIARSTLLGRQPAEFDPLARLLARARARGLQVHAWLNVLLVAHFGQPFPRGHALARHPDWAMVPRAASSASLGASGASRLQLIREAGRSDGDVEGYYLSPCVAAVGEHLEGMVREIARGYPIDGVHFDFIRYPGPEFDYSRAALEGFRKRIGGKDLLGAPGRSPAAWNDYRREVLTALAARLADAARTERPGVVVSAAVAPDEAEAVDHKFQDWPAWLQSGVLSALCPMTYTSDSRLFQQLLDQVRHKMKGQALWAGIGAYRLQPAELVEKIELARQAGAQGVVLFSHESLDPASIRRLRDDAFSKQVAVRDAAAGGRSAGSR